jgi:hypothetical protein
MQLSWALASFSVSWSILQTVGLLGRVISSSQGLIQDNTNTDKHRHTPNIHALCGIRTHDPSLRASEDSSCLRPLDYWPYLFYLIRKYCMCRATRQCIHMTNYKFYQYCHDRTTLHHAQLRVVAGNCSCIPTKFYNRSFDNKGVNPGQYRSQIYHNGIWSHAAIFLAW